jgi:hypothetical protein
MSFNKKVAKVACELYNELLNDNQSNKKCPSELFETEKSSFNNGLQKVAGHFYCEICDYDTSKKSNWKKHLGTKTHSLNKSSNFFNKSIICTICNKTYKTRTGLWYHSKKCKGTLHTETEEKEGEDILDNPNLLVELMKQNTEFKNIIVDQNKTIMELAKNNSASNNNSRILFVTKEIWMISAKYHRLLFGYKKYAGFVI